MQHRGDIMWRNFCPGSTDNARLHVVNVLKASWLDDHRDVIAAVVPPPLSSFSHSQNRAPPPAAPPAPPPSEPVVLSYASVFPKHINMLPDELMLTIFSHVSSDDLERNVSNVCVRWRRLAQHATLIRRMSLREDDGVTTDEARCKLRVAKKLIELRLDTRDDIMLLLEEAIKSRCNLRKLVIKRVGPFVDRMRISEALRRLLLDSNMEELTVSFCFTAVIPRPFFSVMKYRFGNMRKLNLSFIPDLCHDDLGRIISCCPRLADLRLLIINRHPRALVFNDQDLTLIGMLSDTLEVLKIEAAEVTDVGMAILTYCKRLRVLCLRELAMVSDDGLQALRLFKKLESLYLSGVKNITNLGWTMLFIETSWPVLRKLALIHCSVTDKAANILIPSYPGLRSLNILGCTKLSTDIITRLVSCLERLEVIALCLSQVGGCLYWIPAYAPSIKKIVYHSCYYPNGPHLEMYEPYVEHGSDTIFNVPTRSLIMSLNDADGDQMN